MGSNPIQYGFNSTRSLVAGQYLCAGLNFYADHGQCSTAASAYYLVGPLTEWESPIKLSLHFLRLAISLLEDGKSLGRKIEPCWSCCKLRRDAETLSNVKQHRIPGDLVFTFLGLGKDGDGVGIVLDYSKSCRTVSIEVATAYLRRGNLEILATCQGSKTPK